MILKYSLWHDEKDNLSVKTFNVFGPIAGILVLAIVGYVFTHPRESTIYAAMTLGVVLAE